MILTTTQAAARLIDERTGKPITRPRVIALIRAGRLPATKFGNAWQIDENDLELVKVRKPGYPRGRKRNQPLPESRQ